MRKSFLPLCLPVLGALLVLAGCVPKERFWWAPDGTRAAVIVDGRLHLTDAEGRLAEALALGGADADTVEDDAADWLPDSQGLVVLRTHSLANWEDARSLLPAAEAKRIEELASAGPDLLSAAVTLGGNSGEDAPSLLINILPGETEIVMNALLLAWKQQPQAVEAALKEAPGYVPGELEASLEDDATFRVHELVVVRLTEDAKARDTRVLTSSVRALINPDVSPAHEIVAYGRSEGETKTITLEVASLSGDRKGLVATGVAPEFDWSPGGRSIVVIAPIVEEDPLLKRIQRIGVASEAGEILISPEPDNLEITGSVEELATAFIPFQPRAEALPDGSVLFAAQPWVLPARGTQPEHNARLYVIPAGESDPLTLVPTDEGELPMDLGHFVASPDGKRVAIVESETDTLAVVELSTGKVEVVSQPHPRWKCRTLPAWRSDTELTFAAVEEGESGKIRWMLWNAKNGSRTDLSKGWPDTATEGWLERVKSDDSELSKEP